MDGQYIKEFFPFITDVQVQQFSALGSLYNEWNEKINVISRKDISNLLVHHVLHSLAIAKVISFKDNTQVLDVGTGGGFPGIPLAILFPSVKFRLIDRTAKKIKVVNAVKDALQLQNVNAQQIACEQITDKYDFVVSRAVTNLADFIKMSKHTLSKESKNSLPNGILYLKGNDVKEELQNYKGKYTLYNISDFFEDEFFFTKCVVHLPVKKCSICSIPIIINKQKK
ncbi:MAG: 16S rRNA (guanine(527)-N(7))-methyltransferase RsmG [Bacteroidales bacterium]|nr:16S rRNA (guanine(527)-N(7))-methyltransferase RsmG [Bacteroidales bacterium]